MAKYCSNCGSKIEETSKFCTNCGAQIPQQEKTSEIMISASEAEEIATSLVFSAGALLPEKPSKQISSDDKESVNTTIRFIEKIFNSFPEINNESLIGHSEYLKIKNYLNSEPKPSKANPSPPTKQETPKPTPPVTDTQEPSKKKPSESISTLSSSEVVKSRIIGAHTIFPEVHFILYLTDRRIIGARKDRFDSAFESGAAVGGILGAIVGAGVDAVRGPKETTQDKLENLTLDQILAFDEQNWEVTYDELIEVELKKPGFLQDGEINIKGPKGQFNSIFDVEKEEFEKVINMFREVVPKKLKIK